MSELDSPPPRHMTLAVLAGGQSAEREVSLRSGAAVAAAFRAGGHQVFEFDPARDDLSVVDWHRFPVGRPSLGRTVTIDCVFIALHGAFGEDGQVQTLLESQGVPYTGSDSLASALAFSKWEAKRRFLDCGVATPNAVRISSSDPTGFAHSAADSIGYPLVVKPDRQGSSIGVTIVPSRAKLDEALSTCFRFDSVGLLEAAVPGDEWTVAVLDGEALPPIRIGTSRQFYDYTAKYSADDTRYQFEESATSLTNSLVELARSACRALGCSGIARVDIRLDAQGSPFVLEVNTIPGMTDHSLVPKAAERMGLSMTALCEWAIQSALHIHHTRNNSRVLPGLAASRPRRRAG
ncbi:D-alanine--D-alanine ligase Ddl [Caulifigura coniformis]|uniref:D-alanine--D-alanine ligase n=1 Tax=Caulifigura coniformis TaxID=2527983 RepID=A0A517SKF6_9PLAN|nr:D-alanine--D-alanine ligase [Caulifigura coniformis]QDT56598.1 D-alanine--D-alanine ligase Ddl [Caulifigura coniformis]